jgi:hypothetical protein
VVVSAQDLPPVLDSEGAARLLCCAPKTVEEAARNGDLPGHKWGEGWAYPTEALLRRINEIAWQKMLERRALAEAPPNSTLVKVQTNYRQPPALQ